MALISGTRLGPYEILSPIGAGGMGEVYKAKDTRLDRTVAIKILPEHLAESPERKARFEREAKAISQLNHPHICTLHDVGEQDGADFIVMEYIEGETLAERLKKGALPLHEALKYGIQIAGGLDKAHKAGIIHRDLKPDNVMLTKSGVKLLDFGLAKALVTDPFSETSEAPTQQKELTGDRSLVGTLQYMAPEQLEGGDVDARTDIFAFGAVLYETVTGKKAFTGSSAASLIGAILKDEPDPASKLQPLVPAPLDRFVSKCLAKDPDDRWQNARDVETELAWLASSTGEPERAPAKAALSPAIAAFAMVLAVTAAALFWLARDRPAPLVTKTAIQLPEGDILTRRGLLPLAISPDGGRIAYTARSTRGGGTQLYVRELDRFDPTPIDGSENATSPFFSPDGASLGFFHPGERAIKRALLATGQVEPICRLPGRRNVNGAHWQRDGTILFAASSGLWRVPDSGGTPELLSSFEGQEVGSPHGISDGRRVLLTVGDTSAPTVVMLSLDTGEHTSVVEGAQARYVPSEHLVYADDGALWAAPFDVVAAALTGPPARLVEDVDRVNNNVGYSFALSDAGTLVYAGGEVASQLVWVDRAGDESPIMQVEAGYHTVSISPDGRFAVADDQVAGSIWVHDLERGIRTLVARAPTASMPIWHPSGDTVAYAQEPGASVKRADGSGEPERILDQGSPRSYSPDGLTLAFTSQSDIWIREPDGEAKPFLQTEAFEHASVFSPDGRFLAYISDVSGRKEIYVQPYRGPGERVLASINGGTEPVWSPLGNELFYRESAAVMAVPITLGETIEVGRAERLFEGPYQLDNQGHANFDVTPDGERFLMLRRDVGQLEIRVVQNWLEELKQRVPTE